MQLTQLSLALTNILSATSKIVPIPALNLDFTSGTLDPRINFTRTSNATYFDSAGVLTTASTNEPRFDYNPVTLQPNGLLIEEGRINLLLNSDTLSTQSVTVSAVSQTISFYGTGSIALSGAYTGSLTGTGAFPNRVSLTFTPTAGTLTITVTGSVRYAQLEIGLSSTAAPFPTSYIPTTTGQATRNPDIAVMTGTNFSSWYNQSEGTVYAEADRIYTGNFPGYYYPWVINDGTQANEIATYGSQGSIQFTDSIRVSAVNQLDYVFGNWTTEPFKSALAFKLNDTQFAFNGSAKATDTSCTLPTVTQLNIGSRPTSSTNQWNGHIRKLAYWNTRLPNQTLQYLSR